MWILVLIVGFYEYVNDNGLPSHNVSFFIFMEKAQISIQYENGWSQKWYGRFGEEIMILR
jgi:hypothetical protein